MIISSRAFATAQESSPAPGSGHSLFTSRSRRRSAHLTEGWTLARWMLQDRAVNSTRPDSQLVLIVFRFAQWARCRWGTPGRFAAILCQVFNMIVFRVDLSARCDVGPRLRLYHPNSIVVNPGVRMGADCHLRHGTTIGNVVNRDGTERGNPRLGDSVDLGANCVIIGPIELANHARVGALAAVTKNVPAWAVVVGNPARVVRIDLPDPM